MQTRCYFRSSLAVVLAWVVFGLPTLAMQPHVNFDELTQASDAIFVGTVQQAKCRVSPTGNTILTDVTFGAVEVLGVKSGVKLDTTAPVVLTYEGGTLGNVSVWVSESPDLQVGQKYVLFTLMDGKVHCSPLVGGNQGLFRVIKDAKNGTEYVLSAGGKGIAGAQNGKLVCSQTVEKIDGGQFSFAAVIPSLIPMPQTSSDVPTPAVVSTPKKASSVLSLSEFANLVKQTRIGPPPSKPVLPTIFAANNVTIPDEGQTSKLQGSPLQLTADGLSDEDLAALMAARSPQTSTTAMKACKADKGGTLHVCGWVDLYDAMECVPTSFWTYPLDIHAMSSQNRFMDIFRQRSDDGSFGHNWYNEICGFVTEGQRQDAYGSGWGSAIGVCRIYTLSGGCSQILEADVMFKAGLTWRANFADALGNYNAYAYLPVAMHELGHTWGMQCGNETYDYDEPSMMHGAYHDIVEDGFGLHVGEVYLLRRQYDDQTDWRTVNDLGVESYYAQDGLKHATTDKWNWNAQTGGSYVPGETITLHNVTVENMSRYDSPNVNLRVYLSSERNGTTWPCPTVWSWPSIPAEQFAVFDLTTTIPNNVTTYDKYYITLRITGNNDDTEWDDDTSNNTTSVYLPISVTCPSITAPTGVTAADGTSTVSLQVSWNAVADAWAYKVYRAEVNDSASAQAITVPLVTTTYYDSNATPGKTYYYWVSALRECGVESGFGTGNAGYRAIVPPVVTASDRTYGDKIQVTWPAVDGAVTYKVYRSSTYDLSGATAISSWQTELSYDDTTTAPLDQYFYWVKAAVSTTGTNSSSMVLEWCGVGRRGLEPPPDVAASDGTYADYVQVTWGTPTYTGNKYFQVYRSISSTPNSAIALGSWQTEYTFNDTSAAQGATYYYWVKLASSSSGGNASDFSASNTGYRPATPLSAPTGVNASDGTYTNKITITWNAVTDATHYRIYRSQANASMFCVPITEWISGTTFDDTTVSPGVTMYYWIKAAASDSGYRSSAYSTTYGMPYPHSGWRALLTPKGVSASDGTSTAGINVSWTAPTGGNYFQVYRGTTSASVDAVAVSSWITGTSYSDNDTALQGAQVYYYWVKAATNSTGSRATELSSSYNPGWKALFPVTGVTATDGTYLDKVAVTWDSVTGATCYWVYRNTVNDSSTAITVANWQTATTFDDIYANPGQDYFYWVKAATNSSGDYATALSDTDNGYRALPAATNVVASDGTYVNKVRISWSQSSSWAACRVYRNTTDDVGTAVSISNWIYEWYFEDTTAVPGQNYYYWVQAGTGSGGYPTAFAGSDTGFSVCPLVTEVWASNGTFPTHISVTWNPVEGATYYRLYRYNYLVPEAATPLTDWQSETSFDDDTPTPGVYYYYWVKAATGPAGEGSSGWGPEDMGWTKLPAPHIIAAVSRKTHGSAGDYDIDLLAANPVECRKNGPARIQVTFDLPVEGADGLGIEDVRLDGSGASAGTITGVNLPDAYNLVIDLADVSNISYVTISFPGIRNYQGEYVTDTLCFGVLTSDISSLGNGMPDGTVNIYDIIKVKACIDQTANTSTFWADITTLGNGEPDGIINIYDLIAIKDNMDRSLAGQSCPIITPTE